MQSKDAYQEQVNAHIETIHEAMAHYERHLQSTETTSSESHEAALRALKEKRGRLDALLAELGKAGKDSWHHLRETIDSAIEELRTATEHARERLRGDH